MLHWSRDRLEESIGEFTQDGGRGQAPFCVAGSPILLENPCSDTQPHNRPRTRTRKRLGRRARARPTNRIGRRPSTRNGLFLRHYRHSPKRVNVHPSKKEEEHQPEGARLGGLAGKRRVTRTRRPASRRVGARQFLEWSPASRRVGSPAWGAQSSLLSGSRHVAMPRGAGPCDVRHDSNTLKTKAKSIHRESLRVDTR